jgi:hypothetical protein
VLVVVVVRRLDGKIERVMVLLGWRLEEILELLGRIRILELRKGLRLCVTASWALGLVVRGFRSLLLMLNRSPLSIARGMFENSG